MRAKHAVVVAVLAALVVATVVLAVPGGLAPPEPRTPSGETIRNVYWVVLAISAVVFVLIEAALLLFIFRFRRRPETPEDVEGPQIHGNTRLEIIWTLVPAVALAGIAVFTIAKTPDIQGPRGGEGIRVSVEAHQFYWQYEYENGVVALDRLRLPVGTPVTLELQTLDVEHSWWAPELTGKLDLIPGRTNLLSFTPMETGTFKGKCAELCGVQHAFMNTEIEVVRRQEFEEWLSQEEEAQRGEALELGRATYDAVCGKCHGFEGEGDYGPKIAGSPQLTNADSMRTLLRRGQNTDTFEGYMPPDLSTGWPERQFEALLAYFEENPQLSGNGG